MPGNASTIMKRLAAIIALLIAFPAPAELASSPAARLVWGVHTKPAAINPVLTTQSVSASLMDLIFNSLVRVNSRGGIEPDLACSWDISRDEKTYTFHLRKGVLFHDGRELTSRDVAYSFRLYRENSAMYPDLGGMIESCESPDEYTFTLRLKEPQPFFLSRMVRHIMPEDAFAGHELASAPFNYQPVGTGPFMFKEWTNDDQISLTANPRYYEGKPALETITVKSYDDVREVCSALMRGEVDLAGFVTAADYEVLRRDPAFSTHALQGDYYFALVFNVQDEVFQDKNLRLAVAYAVNREQLIERVTGGAGIACHGPFGPDVDSACRIGYSLDRSARLFAEAGWIDDDDDGILEKDGREFELRVLVDTRRETQRKIMMILRQQLLEAGIKLRMVPYDSEAQLTGEFLAAQRPQAMLNALLTAFDPAHQERDWSPATGRNGEKPWGYHNREVARLFSQAKCSVVNCKQIYAKIQAILDQDFPAFFLFYQCDYFAVSARFTNTAGFFSKYMPVHVIKDWGVKDDRR